MASKRTLSFTTILAALVGLCMVAGVLVWQTWRASQISDQGRVPIGGPFSLVDHTGKPVTEKSWPGKHLLVYFGYTYCPDVCPADLQNMSLALTTLEKENPKAAAEIQPLFITIDPERDTVLALKDYVSLFHPRLVGLTGTPEQIEAAKKSYRVYAVKREEEGASDYLMDHTALIYLISPKGEYEAHFTSNTPPAVMAKRLGELAG
ncbi:SCO family protein [Pedomonas mirosovicensis]|uniref:SCO family protein n=1 Tax=Pedomonas mirosovicensis TaxID=2908641 RepID=UPI002168B299|nr:SCO family protein [Pedomonas mirosovicensis]MCH8684070.1 SCO family protein [Pedomonas mirosovicensis]